MDYDIIKGIEDLAKAEQAVKDYQKAVNEYFKLTLKELISFLEAKKHQDNFAFVYYNKIFRLKKSVWSRNPIGDDLKYKYLDTMEISDIKFYKKSVSLEIKYEAKVNDKEITQTGYIFLPYDHIDDFSLIRFCNVYEAEKAYQVGLKRKINKENEEKEKQAIIDKYKKTVKEYEAMKRNLDYLEKLAKEMGYNPEEEKEAEK